MQEKQFVTRRNSVMLQGIAILLMLFHHCFLDPARLHNDYISVFGESQMIEIRLAWACKICVGIYAFLSGYGLACSMERYDGESMIRTLKQGYRKAMSCILKLYQKIWMVCAVFLPVGILFFGASRTPAAVMLALLGDNSYNAEWWYIWQYVLLMLLFPIVEVMIQFIARMDWKWWGFLGGFVVMLTLLIQKYTWNGVVGRNIQFIGNIVFEDIHIFYVLLFIVAYLISRFHIYEKISKKFQWNTAVSVVGGVLTLSIRYFWTYSPDPIGCDFFLVPLFIFLLRIFYIRGKNQMYCQGCSCY